MSNFTVTMTINGKRKYYRGATLAEAEAKRDRDKLIYGAGTGLPPETTVEDMAQIWMALYKSDNLHARSTETLNGILNRYVLPVLGKKRVIDVMPLDIQRLMKTVSKYSKSTQSKVLQVTKGIFTAAEDNDLIQKSPVRSSIKAGGSAPEEVVPLTDDQFRTLMAATKGTRVYPFIMVLRFAGLRKGEALGLMWQDIDFDKSILHVRRSIVYPAAHREGQINNEMKTNNAKRDIPIPPVLVNCLKEEKEKSKSKYVFSMENGKFLSDNSFKRMWDLISYRSATGIGVKKSNADRPILDRPIDFKVHPHQLRHTCVTAWLEAGLDIKAVQYLAGHATPDITMAIYAHFRKDQLMDATAEKIFAGAQKFF